MGPLDDDNLLQEILLRLPPQPSSLPRASAVSRRWQILVAEPGFSGRFRRHHRRNPPILGFFIRHDDLPFVPALEAPNRVSFVPALEAPNRVPPGRFSLQRSDGDQFMPLGCRHGLVLVFNKPKDQILVWDPVTGDQHRLAVPAEVLLHADKAITGAVLCAGDDTQQQHFQVVLTVGRVVACVYSSETGQWGDLISAQLPSGVCLDKPAVLVGDSLYWKLAGNLHGILEFDLEKQSLAEVWVPVQILQEGYLSSIMRAEGGGLGLLLQRECSIRLWKMKTDCDGVTSWGLGRTIELDKLLSLNAVETYIMIPGLAEENNVVFVWIDHILYTVHLESLKFEKLSGTYPLSRYHPFESVYRSRHW